MINIFCFKWGIKYDELYVNRLYKSLIHNIDLPFTFHCITDNSNKIHSNINIIDVKELRKKFQHYSPEQIFTREKLSLFDEPFASWKGLKIWFDLDILIHNNITKILQMSYDKPTFIWNYWRDSRAAILNYNHMTTPINSSFVVWQDRQGENIINQLEKEAEQAFYTFPSLDKYLYYRIHRYNKINFHAPNIVYNYNIGASYPDNLYPRTYQKNYKICLFNTSHKQWARHHDSLIELHETTDWANKLWTQYD